MSEVFVPSEAQWWAMCDANMSEFYPLAKADIARPFVYQRGKGVSYVPFGQHRTAMSLLLAFHEGCARGLDVAQKLDLQYSCGTADFWLEEVLGTAFRSSVGKKVIAWNPQNLTAIERRILGEIEYIG